MKEKNGVTSSVVDPDSLNLDPDPETIRIQGFDDQKFRKKIPVQLKKF
jgi:hypothetical protein